MLSVVDMYSFCILQTNKFSRPTNFRDFHIRSNSRNLIFAN